MKIIYTAEAEKRLKDIFNYYNLNAGRRVALKIVTELIKETEILQNKPNVGVREPLLQNRRLHYFFIVIKNYKVIYRFSQDL
jgi:plasmid stabilization system protein ParE